MKKQKRALMFAKVSAEKVSSMEYQRIEKEQKRNPDVCELSAEKGSLDYCRKSEEKKSNGTEEIELV